MVKHVGQRPTNRQIRGLTLVRKELGASGYLICPVARRYRLNRTQFIAFPKENVQELVMVQITAKDCILVRPFCSKKLDTKVVKALVHARKKSPVPVLQGTQLLAKRKNVRVEHLLSPFGVKEIKVLLGIDLYEKSRSA